MNKIRQKWTKIEFSAHFYCTPIILLFLRKMKKEELSNLLLNFLNINILTIFQEEQVWFKINELKEQEFSENALYRISELMKKLENLILNNQINTEDFDKYFSTLIDMDTELARTKQINDLK